MAKKIFLMLAIALMACAMETSAQTRGIIKRTNDGFVALRSEPTVYSTMLRRLHAGDVVYYSSVGDGWSRVKFSPDGYWQGYVASRLILRDIARRTPSAVLQRRALLRSDKEHKRRFCGTTQRAHHLQHHAAPPACRRRGVLHPRRQWMVQSEFQSQRSLAGLCGLATDTLINNPSRR